MNKKLTPARKVSIALAHEKSLRALATEYGVHHSVIAEIFKESEQRLHDYWTDKSQRQGRPATVRAVKAATAAPEIQQLEKELVLKQMRIDFLELKLQWAHERAQEAQPTVNKQLKKKKKSP
jgi:IS30 family transposase